MNEMPDLTPEDLDPKEMVKRILSGETQMLVLKGAMASYSPGQFDTWPDFCTAVIENAGEQEWDTEDFFMAVGPADDNRCMVNSGSVPDEAAKIVMGLLLKNTKEQLGEVRFAAMVIEFKVNPELAKEMGSDEFDEPGLDEIETPADLPEPNEVRAVYLLSGDEIQIHHYGRRSKEWKTDFIGSPEELKENRDAIVTNYEVAFASYMGARLIRDYAGS